MAEVFFNRILSKNKFVECNNKNTQQKGERQGDGKCRQEVKFNRKPAPHVPKKGEPKDENFNPNHEINIVDEIFFYL